MNYNIEYNKNEMLKRIYEGSKKYKENLLNKNVIFIFQSKEKQKLNFIQTIFNDWNFLHLTGIDYFKNATDFFQDCLDNKLSQKNIKVKNKGFTQLKLEILESAMSINKSAKRIGDYNDNKVNIKIEKVIGNTHYCLGFSNLDSNNKKLKYYYPKTLLQENLKNNIIQDNRIIAIFSKNRNEKLYKEITYLSRDSNIENLKDNIELEKLIDFNSMFSLNKRYQEKINDYFKDLESLEKKYFKLVLLQSLNFY